MHYLLGALMPKSFLSKAVNSTLALGMLTLTSLGAQEADESGAITRAVFKHREHNGVGYDTGYTTAQLFIAPKWKRGFLPFVDVRGHAFDDGKFAANAGIGARFMVSDWALGANFYYDYRSAKNFGPHQLGGGLEVLWKYMDIRINGYGPIADTEIIRIGKFSKFKGNSALFKRGFRGALPSLDWEVGAPLPIGKRCGVWALYSSLGSYYLFEKKVDGVSLGDAAGFKTRFKVSVLDRIHIEANLNYDKIFRTTIQGIVSLTLPIGPRNIKSVKQNALCLAKNQLVERNEIIPIESRRKDIKPF